MFLYIGLINLQNEAQMTLPLSCFTTKSVIIIDLPTGCSAVPPEISKTISFSFSCLGVKFDFCEIYKGT